MHEVSAEAIGSDLQIVRARLTARLLPPTPHLLQHEDTSNALCEAGTPAKSLRGDMDARPREGRMPPVVLRRVLG